MSRSRCPEIKETVQPSVSSRRSFDGCRGHAAISERSIVRSKASWSKGLVNTTFCAGGPEPNGSEAEYEKYGRNRIAEGKLPLCAEVCSTRSLLAGDGDIVAEIYQERVVRRGYGTGAWGWSTAYYGTEAES